MTQEVIIRKGGRKWSVKDNVNRFLFPDEYKKFEDQLKSKQKFSVICLINTGARINEIQNVKVEDCDLDRNRIILRVTKAKAKNGEKNVFDCYEDLYRFDYDDITAKNWIIYKEKKDGN